MAKLSTGEIVKVGDIVGFKCDLEQYGRIVSIKGDAVELEALDDEGFEGDYIGGDELTTETLDSIWAE